MLRTMLGPGPCRDLPSPSGGRPCGIASGDGWPERPGQRMRPGSTRCWRRLLIGPFAARAFIASWIAAGAGPVRPSGASRHLGRAASRTSGFCGSDSREGNGVEAHCRCPRHVRRHAESLEKEKPRVVFDRPAAYDRAQPPSTAVL